jgi:hypothetical protein
MSHVSFAVLVAIVGICYYSVLVISAKAVGEGTGTLLMPLTLLVTHAKSLRDCVASAATRRRGRRYVSLDMNSDDGEDGRNEPAVS